MNNAIMNGLADVDMFERLYMECFCDDCGKCHAKHEAIGLYFRGCQWCENEKNECFEV